MVVMTGKSGRFPGGYFDDGVENKDEGYDYPGRIHEEMIFAPKDSSVPVMKYFNLGSHKQESFGVPVRSLHLSSMLASEKEELVRRLRKELERTRKLLKEAEFRRTDCTTLTSPDSTLNFCKRKSEQGLESIQKQSSLSCGTGTNLNQRNEMSQGAPGRLDSVKGVAGQSTSNAILMKKCDNLLRILMSHQYGWIFKSPVDAVKLQLPDYFTIIKHPMDLGTVKKKIASGAYSGPVDFVADVRLTFSNAMTYNPPGHEVHNMAGTLSKLFETKWKDIEKKFCQTSAQRLCKNSDRFHEFQTTKATSLERERKVTPFQPLPKPKPKPEPIFEQIMTREQKMKLGEELQSMIVDMPSHIFYFLREHSSDWKENGEDEIEIDIDNLSSSTLFKLRKLVDDYLLVKENTLKKVEPCEIKSPNEPGQSNSSMQPFKGRYPFDEDVDIGSNEHPDSSCHPVEVKKSPGHDCRRSISSGSSSEAVRAEQKLSTVESEGHFSGGKNESTEMQMSPNKLYRAAVLKKRFADTILKAQEKALIKGESGDPEKLRREKEELEILQRKGCIHSQMRTVNSLHLLTVYFVPTEKARLQAEAKAAEVARRRAEADAETAAKQKREMEREAARQALLQMEKTAEIIENLRFLEDLEMLSAARTEHFPCSLAETSLEHVEDGYGLSSFKFEGNNPLEKLGLYIREDEEEEDGVSVVNAPSIENGNDDDDLEEGEIN